MLNQLWFRLYLFSGGILLYTFLVRLYRYLLQYRLTLIKNIRDVIGNVSWQFIQSSSPKKCTVIRVWGIRTRVPTAIKHALPFEPPLRSDFRPTSSNSVEKFFLSFFSKENKTLESKKIKLLLRTKDLSLQICFRKFFCWNLSDALPRNVRNFELKISIFQ